MAHSASGQSAETITAEMARWAADLQFDDIPDSAIREARRYLLDTLGCALGGFKQEDAEIALEVLDEVAGEGPATVIGSGRSMDVYPLPWPMLSWSG